MRPATPDRRPTPLLRREKSNTPMRHPNGERSKFCGSTRNGSNVARGEEAAGGRSESVNAKKNTPAGPLRSSQLFGDRPPAATTTTTTTLPPRCVYAPPPTNPKQAAEFWTRMREDNARLAEEHERVCQSKGIAFRPGRRSGSSVPRGGSDAHPAPGRRAIPDDSAPLPGSRRRTASRSERVRRTASAGNLRKPETPVKKVNGSVHSPNHAGNHTTHTTVPSATTINGTTAIAGHTKVKQRGTTNGVAGRPTFTRPRPTISTAATASSYNNTQQTNGVGPYTESELHQGNGVVNKEQDSKIQRQRVVSTPSCGEISGGASPETVSSRRLNCRMETAPYVEGSGGEQSERWSPKKLQYEQYEPPVVEQ